MKQWVLILFLLIAIAPATSVAAQTKPRDSQGGITISPAFQELVLAKDQTGLGGSFAVANNGDKPETFELTTVDMGALDDTGGIVLSGLAQDYRHKYGLADWLTLSQSTLTIPPRNKGTVLFAVKNDESLAPGGHYGAIIVRRASDKSILPSQRVALSPQAASLLFLRKVGGEVYNLTLPDITANHSLWQLPTKASLPFKNNGNVHVVPRGIVRLKNTFGKEIARGIINQDSSLILPERMRSLSVPLMSDSRVVWPGRYTIEVEYRYDGQEKVTTLTKTFYTANLRVLLLLVAGLLVAGTVLYKLRRQIIKVLRKARRLGIKIGSKIRR